MKRLVTMIALFAALGTFLAPSTQAQFRIGPLVGLNFQGPDVLLGLNSHFNIDIGENEFIANPSADVFLFEGGDIKRRTRYNADLLYAIPTPRAHGYVGAGVLFENTTFDLEGTDVPDGLPSSDFDIGLNVKAGVILTQFDSTLKPFIELVGSIRGDNEVAVRGGFLFSLTGNN